MLSEITSQSPIRHHSIAGGVPSWWVGGNNGRKQSPLLTTGNWHSALRNTGFGGIDASTPEMDRVAWPLSVMASQAVDDRVQFLRRPLSAPSPSPSIHIESLVVLGNRTLETVRIGEEVVEHLERFCGETTILNGLPTEDEAQSLNPMSTFLNLVDIDSPIFKDMTAEKMNGLKRMFELAKRIVWVTQGAHMDQAYHMASIAFSRAVRQEEGHISLSNLDISKLQHNESKITAEYLLQQTALDEWDAPPSTLADKQHRDFGLLWSKEPEVFLDCGKLSIPRLVENVEQNARLNSSRRAIVKTVPISGSKVTVISSSADSSPIVVEEVDRKRKAYSDDVVKVESSSLMALHGVGETFLFLGIGKAKDGRSQVSLSSTNSCETTPVVSVAIQPNNETTDVNADALLVAVASELLAESLVQMLSTESHIMVHCSGKDRFLAAALYRRATAKSIRATFTYDSRDERQNSTWLQLNARAPGHVVRKLIRLAKPTHYLDLTAVTTPNDLSLRVATALPANCTRIDPSALFQHQSSLVPLSLDREALLHRLEDAVSSAGLSPPQIQDLVTPLNRLRTLSHRYATSAIHWPLDGLVEIEVRPLDARGLFSHDKTYLLVGLSGRIGQSLCEWMVSNGAGCVCLTSRRPKVDKQWLESFHGTGATVKVVAMDVLDKSNLEQAVKDIRMSCPPIAGVANGAMVLEDQLFANMSMDMMQTALGPKIDGTNNLDDIFHDHDLDFFVLFSSIACVFGNAGQSNYSAANGYLNGFARERRRRGLAASTIDIGRVVGIGISATSGQAVQDQLRKLSLQPVSESDLRQTMAETILSGYPDPRDQEAIPQAVVTTGLRIIGDDEDIKGPWFSNAYFSHLIRESSKATSGSDDQGKKATLPLSQRLPMAASQEEALEILQGSSEFLIPQVQINMLIPRRILGDKGAHYPTARRPANRLRCSSC
jgi:hybrid polyketide synthase/nonribosomal peptide synthetase ACE1